VAAGAAAGQRHASNDLRPALLGAVVAGSAGTAACSLIALVTTPTYTHRWVAASVGNLKSVEPRGATEGMGGVPKPCPKYFCEIVLRVAGNRANSIRHAFRREF
jgi:hypothetical protein